MEPTRFTTLFPKSETHRIESLTNTEYNVNLLGNYNKKELVMARPPIKWLLVEWNTEEFGVISVKSVVRSSLKVSELTTGKLITVAVGNDHVPAKIVMSSDDRKFLEQQIHPMTIHKKELKDPVVDSDPKIYDDAEPIKSPTKDFSASASSWTAEEWDTSSSSSSEEEEIVSKNIKKEKVKRKYTRRQTNGKPPTPALKLQPIIPNNMKVNGSTNNSKINVSNKLPEHVFVPQMNLSDSSLTLGRKRMTYDQQVQTDDVIIPNVKDIYTLQKEIQSCQEILQSTKEALLKMAQIFNTAHVLNTISRNISNAPVNISNGNGLSNPISGQLNLSAEPPIDETLRDTTNIKKRRKKRKTETELINNVKVERKSPPKVANGSLNLSINKPEYSKENSAYEYIIPDMNTPDRNANIKDNHMVPIGIGKTLVSKRIFDEIDWSSYTMATRKLLMAVFPRNVLATHSLTGKSSPAFMNKPPKLCLDPRKVSDIVMTVTKKCNVKENLVRSAITIKCADENKMMKFQQIKLSAKKSNKRQAAGDESDE